VVGPEGNPLHITNSKGHTRRPGTLTLSAALECCKDESFVDFLRKCLTWNPNQRITPTEGLKHAWILKVLMALCLIITIKRTPGKTVGRQLLEHIGTMGCSDK